jgi:hypothetical protein
MARPHRYAKRCGREFWSTGVLRPVGTAPRDGEVGECFQGDFICCLPRAEALGYDL